MSYVGDGYGNNGSNRGSGYRGRGRGDSYRGGRGGRGGNVFLLYMMNCGKGIDFMMLYQIRLL